MKEKRQSKRKLTCTRNIEKQKKSSPTCLSMPPPSHDCGVTSFGKQKKKDLNDSSLSVLWNKRIFHAWFPSIALSLHVRMCYAVRGCSRVFESHGIYDCYSYALPK